MKRILIIGNSVKFNSLEASYSRALSAFGFVVETLSLKDLNSAAAIRLNALATKFTSSSAIFNEQLIVSRIREKEIDCVIVFKCWDLPPRLIRKMRQLCFLINYTSDHPLASHSLRRNIVYERIKLYDLIVTFSENLVPVWYQLGAKDVIVIGFGVDREFRIQPRKNHAYNITYFGTWGPYIESHIEQLGIAGLTIFGPGWRKASSRFRKMYEINPGTDMDMYKLANNSRVVVNFTRLEHGCFHTMKTFEIPNSGSVYLSNYSKEQANFFSEGHEALYYNSKSDFASIVEKINKGSIDMSALREAAFNKSKNYSYERLVLKLCAIIEEI